MYQALYRKYRPSCFSDVVGQDHITITLLNELKTGKVFHAYLFTGPRGTGKTSCAKILSKAANCLSPKDGDACLECDSCREIANGEIMDIIEVDAASNNGVDYIRELREQVAFTPAKAKYRVYIIDEVHMLTDSAFNALLKTLEEPPAHIIFILATTEVHQLPATILSRCQRFDFHRIDSKTISNQLIKVATDEGAKLSDNAAELIANLSDGGMRDALSLLDLCVSTSDNIDEGLVRSVCSLSDSEYLLELSAAIANKDIPDVLNIINSLYKNSVDMQSLCKELISHYRSLMICKTVDNPNNLISLSDNEIFSLKQQCNQLPIEFIMYALRSFSAALENMSLSNRRSELEMAAIKLCTDSLCDEKGALLLRIIELERKINNIDFSSSVHLQQPKNRASQLSQKNSELVSLNPDCKENSSEDLDRSPFDLDEPFASSDVIDDVNDYTSLTCENEASINNNSHKETGNIPIKDWPKILSELAKTCPLMVGILSNSNAYIDGNKLLIDSDNPQFLELLRSENKQTYSNHIRNAANSILGKFYNLGPYHKQNIANQATADPLDDIKRKLEDLKVPSSR